MLTGSLFPIILNENYVLRQLKTLNQFPKT